MVVAAIELREMAERAVAATDSQETAETAAAEAETDVPEEKRDVLKNAVTEDVVAEQDVLMHVVKAVAVAEVQNGMAADVRKAVGVKVETDVLEMPHLNVKKHNNKFFCILRQYRVQ